MTLSRAIKLAISMAVAGTDGCRRLFFRSSMPGACVILNYHTVRSTAKGRFEAQLDYILGATIPICANRPAALSVGQRYVAITVDDVFLSFLENALPALCSRNVPVILFPPTGFLGRPSSWNDYGGENRVGETVLSSDQLKVISQYQNVQIGSHTVTHADLSLLSADAAKNELSGSKKVLEELTGKPVTAFSAPYGRFGPRERKLASECGYSFFYTSTPQSVRGAINEGTFGRVDVQPEDSWLEFKLKVLGAYRWISTASSWKRKAKAFLPGRKPLRQLAHV